MTTCLCHPSCTLPFSKQQLPAFPPSHSPSPAPPNKRAMGLEVELLLFPTKLAPSNINCNSLYHRKCRLASFLTGPAYYFQVTGLSPAGVGFKTKQPQDRQYFKKPLEVSAHVEVGFTFLVGQFYNIFVGYNLVLHVIWCCLLEKEPTFLSGFPRKVL